MKFKILILVIVASIGISCSQEKTTFGKETLDATLTSIDGKATTIGEVLKTHKGKTIVIDVWASWCGDCIKGLPLVKALQEQTKNDEVVHVFLSVDRKQQNWKNTIRKKNITGDHYFVTSGMKGILKDAIDLDWIPRYMVVGKDGKIKLYRAVKADDDKILKAVKADQ